MEFDNMRFHKGITGLLCILLLTMFVMGCGKTTVEQKVVIEDGITVDGLNITARDREISLGERNDKVKSILSCRWIGNDEIAIEGKLAEETNNRYFAIYNLAKGMFRYEQYGQDFMWKDNDSDTLIYVQDYTDNGGNYQVRNIQDVVLFTTGNGEIIQSISYVPRGIKVDVVDQKGTLLRSVVVET